VAAGVLASLAALSFSLACRLTTDPSCTPPVSTSLLGRLLGESRRAIGDDLFEQAERYFHRGVGHSRKAVSMGFLQRLSDEVQPRVPEHLSGGDIYEMMPWLRFATRMDPHNVDAYLGAAFWVAAQDDGHQQHALDILSEAQRNNPADYRIPLERAQLLIHDGELHKAARAVDLALVMWGNTRGVDPGQKRLDRAALLNYRGLLHELDGRSAEALVCYREHLRIRPEADGVRQIVQGIEQGTRSRVDAEKVLQGLMKKKITPDEYCHHDDDQPHDHETAHSPFDLSGH
jgi:tetratricopeptide (TPR) repeat protein